MSSREITDQILSAWDEVENEGEQEPVVEAGEETEEQETEEEIEVTASEEPPSEDEPEADDEDEDGDGDEEEKTEETEEEEAGELVEAEGEEEETPVEDLEVKAFLAKYDGDMDKALRGAAELYRVVGKQGSEKRALADRVAELEAELEQQRAFSTGATLLNEEQRAWVEEAIQSGNPVNYVQQAVNAAEFDLARAICQEWAREDPFTAMRAGQYVDASEHDATNFSTPLDHREVLKALANEFPEMPVYQEQMATIFRRLGDGHPLVVDARSNDMESSMRAIHQIYEIARASSVNVRNAKEKVREQQRQNGASAKAKAVVSSASASPSATETPRTVRLGPGLTLEDLEAEFAR